MKTEIVLDADVIIHFYKGGFLSRLPDILKSYQYVVLSTVYDEIKGSLKSQLDNQILYLKNISLIKFEPKGEMIKEYSMLIKYRGRGESACMVYCKFNHGVIGSSNLKDIKDYCTCNRITYLTTLDFVYYAIINNIMSIDEANAFRNEVCSKDSKLPEVDFNVFVSSVVL